MEKRREELLAEWDAKYDEIFMPDDFNGGICKVCGQRLPPELIAGANKRAFEHWQDVQEKAMQEIETQGKTTADRIIRLQTEKAQIEASVTQKEAAMNDTVKALQEVTDALSQPMAAPDYDSDEELKKLAFALDTVQKQIESKEIKKVIVVKGKIVNIVAI